MEDKTQTQNIDPPRFKERPSKTEELIIFVCFSRKMPNPPKYIAVEA